jgi:hypothetical protein
MNFSAPDVTACQEEPVAEQPRSRSTSPKNSEIGGGRIPLSAGKPKVTIARVQSSADLSVQETQNKLKQSDLKRQDEAEDKRAKSIFDFGKVGWFTMTCANELKTESPTKETETETTSKPTTLPEEQVTPKEAFTTEPKPSETSEKEDDKKVEEAPKPTTTGFQFPGPALETGFSFGVTSTNPSTATSAADSAIKTTETTASTIVTLPDDKPTEKSEEAPKADSPAFAAPVFSGFSFPLQPSEEPKTDKPTTPLFAIAEVSKPPEEKSQEVPQIAEQKPEQKVETPTFPGFSIPSTVQTDKQTPEGEKKSDFSVFDSFKIEETPKSAPSFNFQASSAPPAASAASSLSGFNLGSSSTAGSTGTATPTLSWGAPTKPALQTQKTELFSLTSSGDGTSSSTSTNTSASTALTTSSNVFTFGANSNKDTSSS